MLQASGQECPLHTTIRVGDMKKLPLLLLFVVSLALAQERPPAEISIRHATVINVVTGAELKDQTVVIRGERIASVAPTSDADNCTAQWC